MDFTQAAHSAFRSLREQPLRASLSVLGLVIGVGSVLLLISIGVGVRADIARQVEQLGTNVIFVLPGRLTDSGQPEGMSMLGISSLTSRDADDIARIPGVRKSVPVTFVYGSVERKSQSYSAMVIAAGPSIAGILATPISEGRFYTEQEADAPVCVMGHELRKELFGEGRALGQEIVVRGRRLRIGGVLEAEEPSLFAQASFSRVVYIPYDLAMRAFKGAQINRIIVQTDYATDPDTVTAGLRAALLRNHGAEDFGILTYRQLLAAIFRVFNIVTALIVGISAISLIVAGIGIMNIMLVTVTERTREIGVRMTVGARRRDVFMQFLLESVVMALVGGLAGIGLAAASARAIGALTVLNPIVTPGAIAMAFGVCFAVGVTFGTAPAARAARLDPIEALRHE